MSAPVTTQRSAPVGVKLGDGYQTLIAFAADPDISIWEKQVQPPGIDGGDPVDTTTMHNTSYRTMHSRYLKKLTDGKMVVGYDPRCYPQIVALINVQGSITVHFPDGSAVNFFGYLQNFEPNELQEGNFPEATCKIVPTNTDPSDGSEAGPVYDATGGT